MFDWLFEGHRHLAVYFFLAAAAVVFVVVAVRTRKRRWYAGAAAAAALAGLYFLLGAMVETDSAKIERKIYAMGDAFKAPARLDDVFANVSDQFSVPGAASKAELQKLVEQSIQGYSITAVNVSDVRIGEISREQNTADADFRAKVIYSGGATDAVTVRCRATFDYEATHGWRMRTLKVKGEPPLNDLIDWPSPGGMPTPP